MLVCVCVSAHSQVCAISTCTHVSVLRSRRVLLFCKPCGASHCPKDMASLATLATVHCPPPGAGIACPPATLPLLVKIIEQDFVLSEVSQLHEKSPSPCAPGRCVTCCPRPGAKVCSGTRRVRAWLNQRKPPPSQGQVWGNHSERWVGSTFFKQNNC